MEERGANIVQVPKQREKTAPELVIPHLNLIVISSRDKQWLLLMEVNASYWTWGKKQAIYVKESCTS